MELTITQNRGIPVSENITAFTGVSQTFLTESQFEPVTLKAEIITPFLASGTSELNTNLQNTSPFITANSEDVSLAFLKNSCVIPVFTKDNEITISHTDFIETAFSAIKKMFPNETFDEPEIRVSHQIKGRVPEAIHKNVKDLQDHEKTQYFERMGFIVRI